MQFVSWRSSAIVLFLVTVLGILAPGPLLSQTKSPEPYHKDDELTKPGGHMQPVPDRVAPRPEQPMVPLREIKILPATVSLTIPRLTQRIIVEGTFTDGHQEDLSAKANITSSDPRVAIVDKESYLHPESDGQTTVTAAYQGHSAVASVVVKNFAAHFDWSFRNHVLPVMTKVGCNSGPCHGAAAGKNGFKLTLRGYDPETDYYTLTHQALARRTERLEPAKSLILLKPTAAIAHGGGQRFAVGSPEYQVMGGWIAAGMPPPKDSDPRIVGIEVLPKEASLRRGAEQQLVVMAKFSDGHAEDVTRWAKFTSGDEGVASVDDFGHVKMHSAGEAPVTVWYLSKVTFARLRIPYDFKIDEAVYDKAPRHNYIDDLVLAHLKTLHIPPSRPATDSEFIRRAHLDAAGMLPTPAEVEEFLKDGSPDKRAKLIEKLISRPEFVDYWAYKWSDLLLVSSNRLANEGMWSYYRWIRESVAENEPWNKFVREIITANGNARENGAANYWVIHRNPTDIAENVTVAFMGVNITCAHCHNHPLAEWTQKDYYGMANLFSRVRLKMGAPAGSRPGVGAIFEDVSVFSSPTGQYTDDRFTHPLPPKPLLAPALPVDTSRNLRDYFAEWLTSKENPYFAKALVNRVWRNFMGHGLVEPVDDMRATNPPTNEDLLNALTTHFIESGFDVDALIRTIMESATYQTSSEPAKENAQDEKYYSHYLIRRLPAEVLLDGISQVAHAPEKFDGYPLGMRALQLPDTAVKSYFLDTFGRPPRAQTRESERMSVPTITQALHIINGDTLNNKLRAPDGSIDMLLKLGVPDEQIVDYLFLAAFSRHPRDAEFHSILGGLRAAESQKSAEGASAPDPRRAALVDLGWAVLSSQEFMFNH